MTRSPVHYIVENRGYETPCWIWQRAISSGGYGQIKQLGRQEPAHRVYYEVAIGPIPNGYEVDHLCFERACVNPEHLEAVSPATNKRRQRNVKLGLEDVHDIRTRFERGDPQATLARAFGVDRSLISLIVNRKRWAEV